jgi:hypothetical protein
MANTTQETVQTFQETIRETAFICGVARKYHLTSPIRHPSKPCGYRTVAMTIYLLTPNDTPYASVCIHFEGGMAFNAY